MIVRNAYRIEPAGTQFNLIGPEDERVAEYTAEDDAKQHLERCVRDASMLDTAKLLVNIAVKTHMLTHGVNRETALHWVRIASDMA